MSKGIVPQGIWTEHWTNDGRKYYFNMMYGQSYWSISSGTLIHNQSMVDQFMPMTPASLSGPLQVIPPIPETVTNPTKSAIVDDFLQQIGNDVINKKRKIEDEIVVDEKDALVAAMEAKKAILANVEKEKTEREESKRQSKALEERMALVAQKKQKEKIEQEKEEKSSSSILSDGQNEESGQAYLNMVRQLKKVDKETDCTGGKWLVR